MIDDEKRSKELPKEDKEKGFHQIMKYFQCGTPTPLPSVGGFQHCAGSTPEGAGQLLC
jgi:hypothetical protein